jgi:hypothetical protein
MMGNLQGLDGLCRQFFPDPHQIVDLQSALRLAYPRDVLQEEEEASCIASHLCLCRQLFLDQLQMVDPQQGLQRVSPGQSRLRGYGEKEIAAQSLPSEDLPVNTFHHLERKSFRPGGWPQDSRKFWRDERCC